MKIKYYVLPVKLIIIEWKMIMKTYEIIFIVIKNMTRMRRPASRSAGDLVFLRFLSRAVSAQLRGLGRFRLCGTRPRASLRRSALRRASETDYAQKPETQTIPVECASPVTACG